MTTLEVVLTFTTALSALVAFVAVLRLSAAENELENAIEARDEHLAQLAITEEVLGHTQRLKDVYRRNAEDIARRAIVWQSPMIVSRFMTDQAVDHVELEALAKKTIRDDLYSHLTQNLVFDREELPGGDLRITGKVHASAVAWEPPAKSPAA